MDLAELQELCRSYQRLLRLQDWRITVQFMEEDEADVVGCSDYLVPGKLAIIKIIKEENYNFDRWLEPYDPELILAHELGHILFYPVDREGCLEFEFALEATAEALVKLRRANGS